LEGAYRRMLIAIATLCLRRAHGHSPARLFSLTSSDVNQPKSAISTRR
jgi:hypothetical protein